MSAAEAVRKPSEDSSVARIASKHDAIGYLSHQHREIEALFHDLDAISAKDFKVREQIFVRLAAHISMHTRIEEEIFYPAVRKADEDMILQSLEEHDLVKNLVAKIQQGGDEDPTFKAKVNVLREIVHHHVMQEEQEFFPKVMETISEEDMRGLFDAMRAMGDREKTEGP